VTPEVKIEDRLSGETSIPQLQKISLFPSTAHFSMAIASSSETFLPYGLKKLLEQLKKQVSAKATSKSKRFKFVLPVLLTPRFDATILVQAQDDLHRLLDFQMHPEAAQSSQNLAVHISCCAVILTEAIGRASLESFCSIEARTSKRYRS